MNRTKREALADIPDQKKRKGTGAHEERHPTENCEKSPWQNKQKPES